MEVEAFKEAEQINRVPVPGVIGAITQGIYVARDPKSRQSLVRRSVYLSTGVPDPELPTEPAVRGQEVLKIISALHTTPAHS